MTDPSRVEFLLGNIAEVDCDVIVNPCGSGFAFSHAGVNGALAAAAGPDYVAETAELWRLEWEIDSYVGHQVTGAGALQARYVIHAVSPIWKGGRTIYGRSDKEELFRFHERVLRVAAGPLRARSVVLPAVGTGAHGFPPEVAASIAVPTVEAFLEGRPHDRLAYVAAGCAESVLERVVFVFQTRAMLHDYLAHSSNSDHRDVLLAGLRDEITGHLRAGRRTRLAETVDQIADEVTLRAILSEAHRLSHEARGDARDHSASVGISTVYSHAVERVLGLEP
jgi:O-acetyl-ADP-ribose deacetylase (regulator of RNase III)